MSPTRSPGSNGRFPDFDVLTQSKHWDPVTTGVVLSRTGMAPDIRFFTSDEQAVATALCDQLLDQRGDRDVPVVNLIDARLAEHRTDGWRYHDMPEDGRAWRDTLAALDDDARASFHTGFASCTGDQRSTLIRVVHELGTQPWHGLCAGHVWSLWTRYACTAFYSHPSAWNEIGFPGPAYPRGYKNPGLGSREPFEVHDAKPDDDPVRRRP